jgi:hypothetical protein
MYSYQIFFILIQQGKIVLPNDAQSIDKQPSSAISAVSGSPNEIKLNTDDLAEVSSEAPDASEFNSDDSPEIPSDSA